MVQLFQIVLRHLKEVVEASTRLILHGERNAVTKTVTGNHRRTECDYLCTLDAGYLLIDGAKNHVRAAHIYKEAHNAIALPQSRKLIEEATCTFFKRFEFKHKRSLVGTLACDEVIARNLFAALYHGIVSQHLIHLVYHLLGTLLAGGWWQRDGYEECSRVFVRHKTRLGCAHSEH